MMKAILAGIVVPMLTSWGLADTAKGCNAQPTKQCVRQVVVANQDDQYAYTLTANRFVVESDSEVAGEEPRQIMIRVGASYDPGNGGWLGVGISLVPESLAAQLGVADSGVMITNVVEGSPADDAGLKRHDVILSVNDVAVESDVPAAVNAIKAHHPGDVVTLTILREARKRALEVVLGERPESKFNWKFDVSPQIEIEDEIQTRGRFIFRSDDGEWIVKDLGDMDLSESLPEELRFFTPRVGTKKHIIVDGQGEKLELKVTREGATLSVSQKDDGDIVVTRTDEKGLVEENTYPNEDELKAGDEEAYELYKSSHSHTGHFHMFMPHVEEMEGFNTYSVDLGKLYGNLDLHQIGDIEGEIKGRIMIKIDEAMDDFEDAMEKMSTIIDSKGNTFVIDAANRLGTIGESFNIHHPHSFTMHMGKPKHSFTVNAKGQIEVYIRSGDGELTKIFADERDLEDRAPNLYEKYKALDDID